MTDEIENALRQEGVSNANTKRVYYKTILSHPIEHCKQQYKLYPPFGRQILKTREAGFIPSRMIMVVFSWKLAKKWPRIVIPDDIPYKGLNFDYLAGLPVEIAYQNKDAHKIPIVSEDILAVNPSFLSVLGLDLLDKGEARTLLKPQEFAAGI